MMRLKPGQRNRHDMTTPPNRATWHLTRARRARRYRRQLITALLLRTLR